MGQGDDWYRNERWDPDEEKDFLRRVGRARSDFNKAEALRIKAVYLIASRDPLRIRGAMALLERALTEFPAHVERANCHALLGQGHDALGEMDSAIQSYLRALKLEKTTRSSGAWPGLARAVILRKRSDLYPELLDALADHESEAALPGDKFVLHAARAVVAFEKGDWLKAGRNAAAALGWAETRDSGMSKHKDLGLVSPDDPLIPRLRNLLEDPRVTEAIA
ncbi:MAG TPA: hypothetical protein VF950_29195 [Planctomycetota bacterium]